jgi:hypothetical protein
MTCEQSAAATGIPATRITTAGGSRGGSAAFGSRAAATLGSMLGMDPSQQTNASAAIRTTAALACTTATMMATEQSATAIGHRRRTKSNDCESSQCQTGNTNSNHSKLPPERTINVIHAKLLDAHPDNMDRA